MLYPANPLLLKTIKHEKMSDMMRQVQIDRMVNQIEKQQQHRWTLHFRNAVRRSVHGLLTFRKHFKHHRTQAA